MTLYEELVAAGIKVDHHESDLYFPMTDKSRWILERYPLMDHNTTIFVHNETGELWYDTPFAYTPWWEARCPKCGGASPNCP